MIAAAVLALMLAEAPLSAPLAGTSWQLVSIGGYPIPGGARRATLTFQHGGRLLGDDGCNGFGDGYRLSDTRLALTGDGIVTTMACLSRTDPDLMARANAFRGALEGARVVLDGDVLRLRAADGRRLRLRRISLPDGDPP